MFSKRIAEWVCLIVQAMWYSQVALPTRRVHVMEGRAMLGVTGAFREAGCSRCHPCPPHPGAGGSAATRCISTPQLFQFTAQLTEVSKGDIKYHLPTWSNWGMSMFLGFCRGINFQWGRAESSISFGRNSCLLRRNAGVQRPREGLYTSVLAEAHWRAPCAWRRMLMWSSSLGSGSVLFITFTCLHCSFI